MAIVEVTLDDGTKLTERVEAVRGTPENPMSREEVVAKARDLIVPVLGASKCDALIAKLLALESVKDVRELRPLLQRVRSLNIAPRASNPCVGIDWRDHVKIVANNCERGSAAARQHLVLAGNQRASRQLHERTNALGGARRNFNCGRDRWLDLGQPDARGCSARLCFQAGRFCRELRVPA